MHNVPTFPAVRHQQERATSLDLVHRRRISATGQHCQADNGGSRMQEDDTKDVTDQTTSVSACKACSVQPQAFVGTHALGTNMPW